MGGVHFNPTIEIFYTYPEDTPLGHSSDLAPQEVYNNHATLYPTSGELSLSSPCTSTDSFLFGRSNHPSVEHVNLNPSSRQFPHTSSRFVGRYEEALSSISHPDVPSYKVPRSTSSKSIDIERSSSGGELSDKDLKNYDSTGLHIALSSKLDLLDYDISQSPEKENSIAETEALSAYLDKPATLDQSHAVGIQHHALPVIIWITVSTGYITVLDVLHGLYEFMMRPPLDKWKDFEPIQRQAAIRGARDTRIRKSRCMDKSVKWIDWMPRNRRIICLSKGPECREHTWMIRLEGDGAWKL